MRILLLIAALLACAGLTDSAIAGGCPNLFKQNTRIFSLNPSVDGMEHFWISADEMLVIVRKGKVCDVHTIDVNGKVETNTSMARLLTQITAASASPIRPAFGISPDGKMLSVIDQQREGGTFKVVRTDTGAIMANNPVREDAVYTVVWLPNSSAWILVERARTNALAKWMDGAALRTSPIDPAGMAAIGATKGGNLLFMAKLRDPKLPVRINEVPIREEVVLTNTWEIQLPSGSRLEAVALSPSGEKFLWKLRRHRFPFREQVSMWTSDLAGKQFVCRGTLTQAEALEATFEWSPDERRISTILHGKIYVVSL